MDTSGWGTILSRGHLGSFLLVDSDGIADGVMLWLEGKSADEQGPRLAHSAGASCTVLLRRNISRGVVRVQRAGEVAEATRRSWKSS